MRKLLLAPTLVIVLSSTASAIPQEFGAIIGAGSAGPRSIQDDFTEQLVAIAAWRDGELPGDWTEVPSLDGDTVKRLDVAPKLFGDQTFAVFARYDASRLQSISALYLDAGVHYGYKPAPSEIRAKQREFKKRYASLEDALSEDLEDRAEGRPEESHVGRTKFLRAEYLDYPLGELVARYSAVEGHSISVTLLREDDAADRDYLDDEVAALDTRDRREALIENVTREDDGDTFIEGVPMFQQGQRPYCSVSTLGMATHYLGLRLGSDALAAGAKFRGTGSAKGAKILELYKAAADEANASIQRGGSFDFDRAQKAIDKGFPIVVWRRYDSERNQLHSAAARGGSLPEPDRDDREGWPTSKDAPGHASVVTGYNAETREVIFSESWGEHARDKRMRAEELEATSYAVFYFKI